MKKIVLLLAVLSILFLTGCSIMGIHSVTSKTKDIYGSGVLHNPVVADLNVQNTRITDEYITEGPQNPTAAIISDAKSFAVAAALKEHSADVLIEPTFEVHIASKSTNKSEIKIMVTGYPATYKNFRNATQGDVELIEDTANVRMLSTADKKDATIVGFTPKKSKWYLMPILGISEYSRSYGTEGLFPLIGLEVYYDMDKIGRLGVSASASIASLTLRYGYPIKLGKSFTILPNIGLGLAGDDEIAFGLGLRADYDLNSRLLIGAGTNYFTGDGERLFMLYGSIGFKF